MDSFLAFMLNDRNSIAFRLVDAGYDVWLNNSRGNRFSNEHQLLDLKMPNQKDEMNCHVLKCREKYFDYSFHEMGVYDQPALWKFVMKETNQKKITYIGHSQGTT